MDTVYIDAFSKAAVNVFKTALDCDVQRDRLSSKETNDPVFEVSCKISLTGKVHGAVVLSLSAPMAFYAVEAMLGAKASEIDSDVVDAVGELTNMIAGGAKTWLTECQLSLGLPESLMGPSRAVEYPPNASPLCLVFASTRGPFAIEVGLAPPLSMAEQSPSTSCVAC